MANSLGDLQPDRVMSVEKYMASIESPTKRQQVAALLQWATSVYPIIRLSSPALGVDPPTLRISKDPTPDATCMEGLVEFSTGLIDYCLGVVFLNTAEAVGVVTPWPMLMEASVLTWFYAHECQHIARQHNLLLDHVDVDHTTLRAIERDADLCGVASLYRAMQVAFSDQLADIDIRKLVVYAMFLALRTLTDKPQQTHSRPDERLLNAIGKISTLNVDPSDLQVDVTFESPKSKERMEVLAATVRDLEKAFKDKHPADCSDFDLRARALDWSSGERDFSTITRWDELRVQHSILTGQLS